MWIIQNDVWDDYELRGLQEALHKLNIKHEIINPTCFDVAKYRNATKHSIFCYGSVEWVDSIQSLNLQEFMILGTFNQFACIEYYPHFLDKMFNKQYTITTANDFVYDVHKYLKQYNGSLFVRPNSGKKPNGISGCIVNEQNHESISRLIQDNLHKHEFLLIAPQQHIDFEYRCVISNNHVVTGCQYMSFDYSTQKLGIDPASYLPIEVKEYAEMTSAQHASQWSGPSTYIMDVVMYNQQLAVMELNCLNTSGLYDCDYDKVVEIVTTLQKIIAE